MAAAASLLLLHRCPVLIFPMSRLPCFFAAAAPYPGTLDILVPNLLTACADGDRGVALAANQALLGLMASMPPGRCLDLLQARLPVAPPPAAAAAALNQQGGAASSSSGGGGGAVDSSSDVLCVAIRCLQVLVQRMAPAELQPRATSAAGGLLSGLFQAFEHSR